jgi:integrase
MAKRGPKGQILPPGITWDTGKCRYRLRWKKADGAWGTASGGRNLEAAKRRLTELKRQARDGIVERAGSVSRSVRLADYIEHWAAVQKRRGRRNVGREANQLRLHVATILGAKRPADVTPGEIINLCWALYDEGNGLAASTITKNLKGSLSSLLSQAVLDEICEINPCMQIPRGTLPKPGKNPWPPFEKPEAERLMADTRISLDGRMLYRLAFFLMERCGEACGIRFSHWDRTMAPLSGITVATQYEDQPLKGTRDDYIADRRVPVHPRLLRDLEWWEAEGFESVFHRPPRPDDFIVPRLPPDASKARSHSQVWKALEDDMELVGVKKLPGRATHGFRKAFISIACNDDEAGMAPENVIKALSHTSTSREAFESYRRWSWETYCKAVQCVRVDLSEPGQVISIGGRDAS